MATTSSHVSKIIGRVAVTMDAGEITAKLPQLEKSTLDAEAITTAWLPPPPKTHNQPSNAYDTAAVDENDLIKQTSNWRAGERRLHRTGIQKKRLPSGCRPPQQLHSQLNQLFNAWCRG